MIQNYKYLSNSTQQIKSACAPRDRLFRGDRAPHFPLSVFLVSLVGRHDALHQRVAHHVRLGQMTKGNAVNIL